MMPKIKICGITNLIDAKNALNLGADYIGFINIDQSPRYISIEEIQDICREFTKSEKNNFVLLSIEHNVDKLVNDLSRLGFRIVQPYGNLSLEDLSRLKLMGFKILKPVQINSDSNIESLDEFRKSVDLLILDSSDNNGKLGGTGKVFDWNLFVKAQNSLEIDLALSGGLNCENILDALTTTNAKMIDISSGLEQKPGIKSLNKMKQIFSLIQSRSGASSTI